MAAAEDPTVQERGVRNVESVLQRSAQGAIEVVPENHLAGARTVDRGEGERAPGRLGIRLSPGPNDAVLLHCGVRWNAPATVRLRAATEEPRNAHAVPAAIVGPSVVAAFEHAIAGDPPKRERVVAMVAAVQEDSGRAFGATEHHQRTVHKRDGQRPAAQLRRPGHRVPPAARKGHGVRHGIHAPMMPVLQGRGAPASSLRSSPVLTRCGSSTVGPILKLSCELRLYSHREEQPTMEIRFRYDPARRALVLVDVQNDFCHPNGPSLVRRVTSVAGRRWPWPDVPSARIDRACRWLDTAW